MKNTVAKHWLVLAALLSVHCSENSDSGAAESPPGAGGTPSATGSGAGGDSAGSIPGAPDASSGSGGGVGSGGAAMGSGGNATPADSGKEGGGQGKAPFDWVGVIGSGQSLSTGCCDGIPLSTTQPFKN